MTPEQYAKLAELRNSRKDPEARRRGFENRKNGDELEQLVLDACDDLREKGIADIDKTPEPFKVLTGMHRLKNGSMGFEGVFAKKAQPDFKGVLSGGRAVIFEAKYTVTDRITQDQVSETQSMCMSRQHAMGAVVFVIVGMGQEYFRVPWDVWVSMKERFGHKYMNREDLRCFEIAYRNRILRILEGIEHEI